MKKMFICCSVLCMALLLFCGTAWATDSQIQVTLADPDAVQVEQIARGEDVAFRVTKSSGVEENQLYLIMIQEGENVTDRPRPTRDNLYYLNVEAATGSSLSLEAYPKDLQEDTSYIVYLSNYSDGSNGAASGVATITLRSGSSGGDSGDTGGGTTTVLYGDVDGDGRVRSWDATVLARYLAGQSEFQNINEANADCNGDGRVRSWDLTVLYRHLAGQSEYATLPHTGG